jgi:hypothetical protein
MLYEIKKESNCAHCGKAFESKRKNVKYCSATCKVYASQTRTGRKEAIETPSVKGINVDALLVQYKKFETECIDLQEKIKGNTYKERVRLERKLFSVKREMFHLFNELFQNGYSGEVVKDYKNVIPVYPFWYEDLFPVNMLGEPIYPFVAYICHGNKRGNTNLLLRFAQTLVTEFDFKVVFFTESLKKMNNGFIDECDYSYFVNLDLAKITVKIIKNRVDIESFLIQNDKKFDFICMDCENINIDADFLESLQQKHLYLSIICTTVKPVPNIVENATYTLNLKGYDSSFKFDNVHSNLDYQLEIDYYWGDIPK